jgi:acetolactate synthase I/II/III large subunit
MLIYELLAEAFAREDVEVVFGLMGDGNMHWWARAVERGIRFVHPRHEGAAVLMAHGYGKARGGVGVCSIFCGPGVSQAATALTHAARNHVPLVVFAADTPTEDPGHTQELDQGRFSESCGALFQPVPSARTAAEDVRLAFYRARLERRPVLLKVPVDLQSPEYTGGAYRPSAALRALAGWIGALTSTTLLARGYLDKNEFAVGLAGMLASAPATELLANADLVLVFGGSLESFTLASGRLFIRAQVVSVTTDPERSDSGLPADSYLLADATATAEFAAAAGPYLLDARVSRTVVSDLYRVEHLSAAGAAPHRVAARPVRT